MIHLVKYKKSYGAVTVLEIEDFVIRPGVYWLRGANGSGKSTLLKSIAGIIHFDGEILFNSVSLKKQPVTFRQVVNFGDAEPVFPSFLTGMELIKLFLTAKEGAKGQEETYLAEMKMNEYINDPVGSYSSGMLKRLSVVLAFLGNPQMILLDEPLITLDQDSIKILYRWIREKSGKNVSFLLSSHQDLDVNDLPGVHQLLAEKKSIKQIP